jgi:SagB-type dehydrogenase family enzyme
MKRKHIQVKRSNCLVFFFQDGNLHCKNYLTGQELEASPTLVLFLAELNRWRSFHDVERSLPQYSAMSIRQGLRQLIRHSAVVIRGGAQASRENSLAGWQTWGVEARFFHFATKDTHSKPITTDEAKFNRARACLRPPPPSVKRYRSLPRMALPDPGPGLCGQLPEVLLARRTHRSFGTGTVSLEQLSILLRLTWGFTGDIDWPGLGRLPVKTSPSGGARHSLEVYVWCSRVKGLTPGVYHYRPDRHCLELLKAGKVSGRLSRLCGHQAWVQACSALFVMTSVLARVMWRYRYARAYRVILLEAGHFCQTFCLVATWLGLAPFCTAALDDEKVERDLALQTSEPVLYAAGVGPTRP